MERHIAERRLKYRQKEGGPQKNLSIRIGVPYIDSSGMARCPVEWDGLFDEYADIGGMDTLQALQLASDIDSMLRRLSKKYDFYWENGETYFDEE